MAVTPDGKIVSGSRDRTVRIWDMQGHQLQLLEGHEDEVTSVAVTPDGDIVSGSRDRTVRIWDKQGHQLQLLVGHEGTVFSVAVTPDGKIVSGSRDSTMRIWDMRGNQLRVLAGHGDGFHSVAVTPDNYIVSADKGKVLVWNTRGQLVAKWRQKESGVMQGDLVFTFNDLIVFVRSGISVGFPPIFFDLCIFDIKELNRLSSINPTQAQHICDALQHFSDSDKKNCWRVIQHILADPNFTDYHYYDNLDMVKKVLCIVLAGLLIKWLLGSKAKNTETSVPADRNHSDEENSQEEARKTIKPSDVATD